MQNLSWANKWLQLPESFYQKLAPTPLYDPYFVRCNAQLGERLGLNAEQLKSDAALHCFNGNKLFTDIAAHCYRLCGALIWYFYFKIRRWQSYFIGRNARCRWANL